MILSISRNIIINPKAYLKVSRLILQWLCENKSIYLSTSLSFILTPYLVCSVTKRKKKKKKEFVFQQLEKIVILLSLRVEIKLFKLMSLVNI